MISPGAAFLLVETALRDPWRAQTDPASVRESYVARNGVGVGYHADNIENARGLVTAQ
jgi:hypothetical protein